MPQKKDPLPEGFVEFVRSSPRQLRMVLATLTILAIAFFMFCEISFADKNFALSIVDALEKTTGALNAIGSEWEIAKYPRFLKSCQMHKSSWEKMKLRFMESIVRHHVSSGSPGPFVVSFMGSSVTAGSDSNFNQSYPLVALEWMKEPFKAAGIELKVRNHAVSNNPCMPYDICVGTFAGYDADIVHFEQSYNCFYPPMYEQFVRQASLLPKNPIVVYSESETAHWQEQDCYPTKKPKTNLDKEETKLLSYILHTLETNSTVTDGVEMIVSELNKDEFKKTWRDRLKDVVAAYSGSGVQTFTHSSHDVYACLGPYIPNWLKGAASWHPSVVAHRLRAAQFSYFWLLNFREALIVLKNAVEKNKQSAAMILEEVHHKNQDWSKKHKWPTKRHNDEPVGVADRAKCYTSVVPRASKDYGLTNIVIGGSHSFPDLPDSEVKDFVENHREVWGHVIMDLLIAPSWTLKGRSRGYVAYKYVLYGSAQAGPISLKLPVADTTVESDRVIICQVAGEFGRLPKGWVKMADAKPDIYVTLDVDLSTYSLETAPFTFNKDKAGLIPWIKMDDYCISLNEFVKPGNHVLTISPTSPSIFHFSYIVTA